MLYSDLVPHTACLPVGKHIIYDLEDGKVTIRNMGQRNWMTSERHEHRLILFAENREIAPRHSDFFTDYLLKVETRPDLKLALFEASQQVCGGDDPVEVMKDRGFPRHFDTLDDDNWSMQMSMHQTGGLPTAIYLCGLQCLIRVYDLNRMLEKPAESFLQAFANIEHGVSLIEVLNTLQPKPMPQKMYFDLSERHG